MAFEKSAEQSSTKARVGDRIADEYLAVDGNTFSNWSDITCSSTAGENGVGTVNPWWKVNLESNHEIALVRLFNRSGQQCSIINDCALRLNNAFVEVLDSSGIVIATEQINGVAGAVNDLFFPPGTFGSQVRVRVESGNMILSLCEVEVYARTYCDPSVDANCRCFQFENVALNQATSQINTYSGGVASRAVDGITYSVFNSDDTVVPNSCTHTDDNGSQDPWWQVDLDDYYSIGMVRIYNRSQNYSSRLSDVTVKVGDGFGWFDIQSSSGEVASHEEFYFGNTGVSGSAVRVEMQGSGKVLTLCEVEVFVASSCLHPSAAPSPNPTKSPTKRPTESPTRKPTKSPTNKPTESPSKKPTTKSPTNRPTESPTNKSPTNRPTESPTTKSPTNKPTESPSKKPTTKSPTNRPTESPTTKSPTNKPTESPTKKPTTLAPVIAPAIAPVTMAPISPNSNPTTGNNETPVWQITKPNKSSVQFNDDEPEIRAIFRISTPQATNETMRINFLDFDTCEDELYNPYLNESIGVAEIVPGTDDILSDVPVNITFARTVVTQAPSWRWTNSSQTHANFAFCARIDLLMTGNDAFDFSATPEEHFGNNVLEPILFQSVSYLKVLYNLTVDMTQNFAVDIETEEVLTEDDVQQAKVAYNIKACHCAYDTKECYPQGGGSPVLNQNTLLNICLEPDETDDIVISSIWQYSLKQASLEVGMIANGNENSLTTVSDLGQKKVMISSTLASVFFIDDSVNVVAEGVAILRFQNTNRRMLSLVQMEMAPPQRRVQDVNPDGEGDGTFSVEVSLMGSTSVEQKNGEFVSAGEYGGVGIANALTAVFIVLGVFSS